MTHAPQLRVVLIGRDLAIKPVEAALTRKGASNYICVDTIDAAEWLIRDGYAADLLIVHDALIPRAYDLTELRRRNPEAIVLPTAARCDEADVAIALAAAIRGGQDRSTARKSARLPFGRSIFANFDRQAAWS